VQKKIYFVVVGGRGRIVELWALDHNSKPNVTSVTNHPYAHPCTKLSILLRVLATSPR
jgi:hypothetical protein